VKSRTAALGKRSLATGLVLLALAAVQTERSSQPVRNQPDDYSLVRVRRVRIGHSTSGRPIRATRIGDSSSRHTALVVGVIHGNEQAGNKIVRALMTRRRPRNLTLWIIKDLNPDGSAARTRQNGRGVDLNRNFRRKWRPIGERWDTYYSGPRPFSEPESRAARDFIRKIRPDVTIWYHQAMRLVDRSGRGRRVRRRYARLVDLPLKPIGPLPGTATRWQNYHFRRDVAFVVELPAGELTWAAAKRHARAVRVVGKM
jgi:murein peptide amidase A